MAEKKDQKHIIERKENSGQKEKKDIHGIVERPRPETPAPTQRDRTDNKK